MTNHKWITASEQTPDQWAVERWGKGELVNGRIRVKLVDGRQIYTWWKDGQWSVERLKPHLKVELWERPVFIA
jgi:hypothetical protein